MNKIKNLLVLFVFFIGDIHSLFYGSVARLNLGLFVERSTRIDMFVMYYANAISFLVLAYLLHNPKGIDKRVTRLLLLVTIIDLVGMMLLSGQVFGITKIIVAFMILGVYEFRKKYI